MCKAAFMYHHGEHVLFHEVNACDIHYIMVEREVVLVLNPELGIS